MTQFRRLVAASALALATAPAAWADVSANDVWTQWKDYVSRSGQTMTSTSEQMSGDTLTISGLAVTMTQTDVSYSANIGTLTLKENGDGTVTIGVPASYPVEITVTPPGESAAKIGLTVSQTGMEMTAKGDPGAVSYAYSAGALSISLDSFEGPDTDVTLTANATLSGVTGNYDFGAGDPQPFESKLDAQALSLIFDLKAPSEQGALSVKLDAANITGTSNGAMPGAVDYADMSKALAAGFKVAGGLGFGQATYDIGFQDRSDTMTAKASMASGGVDFAMSSDGMSYQTRSKDLDLTLTGSTIPLPQVNLKMAESGFGLTMPIVKSETPQNYGLMLRMVGLQIDDMIWGMIDPTNQLGRDPANIIFDVSGTGNWLIDITSPDAEQQMGMAMGMPGQIQTLDVKELELTAAGASLTGTGGFTFDNNDLMTWGGMPAPDGSVNLQLAGANALIDKLVGMGLLPQDQAMGAKMMMGMFAKPGAGPDTLTSEIKVTKDGHVFANGQQLQ